MSALRMIIQGSVQGVYFRAQARKKEQELGLTGWVRNNADGSVEIHAEGEEAALKELEEWCHRGPPRARVERIDVEKVIEQNYPTFEILA